MFNHRGHKTIECVWWNLLIPVREALNLCETMNDLRYESLCALRVL